MGYPSLSPLMNITNFFRLSGPVLQVCLLLLLIKRGAHLTFRFFCAYTVFAVVSGVTKFLVREHALVHFYLFWSAEAVYAILGFAALYEVYYHLFRHLYYRPLIRYAFPAIALAVLALSGIWIWLPSQPVHAILLLRVIAALEFALRLLQMAFFLLIIFLAIYRSDSTRRYGYGIAIGFGVSASGIYAASLIFSEFGTRYKTLLSFLPPVAYLVAIIIWLDTFARPEPPERFASYRDPDPGQMLERLRQLKKQAKEIFGPWLDLSFFRSGSGWR